MIKVLELFSGIGACSKALERLGIEHKIVDSVEIDKYAVKSFNAIHGTKFEPQDITKWDKDIECDLIMHGSPCQDFSVAGLGKGGDKDSGTRSSLMYETLRIVEKLKPKYVIWENVKNLLSKKHQHNYFAYIKAMNALGYKSYGRVLNAKDYGVPQNRERVFTISILGDGDFEFPEPIPLEKKLKDILESDVDEKYYISQAMMDYFMGVNQKPSKFPRKERFLANINRKDQDRANSITTNSGNRPTDNFVKEPFCVASRGRNPQNPSDRTTGCPTEQRLEPKFDGTTNTITTVQKDNYVATPYRIRKLTPKDFMWYNGVYEERYKENREILQILQQKIGEEAFCEWAIRGLWCILSESVLWERVYAKGIFENWVKRPELVKFAYFGKNNQPIIPTQEQVRNMWVNWQDRYPSYRRELSEQQFRQLKSVVQKLPHQVASFQGFVQGLWKTYEGTGLLRQALSEIQKIWESDACWEIQWPDCRIRKLTPLSCWRLMGFDDSDFEKAEKVNSNTQLYKQAGNSIVVNVLEGILKNLLEEIK